MQCQRTMRSRKTRINILVLLARKYIPRNSNFRSVSLILAFASKPWRVLCSRLEYCLDHSCLKSHVFKFEKWPWTG